jgi:hypothetical protein
LPCPAGDAPARQAGHGPEENDQDTNIQKKHFRGEIADVGAAKAERRFNSRIDSGNRHDMAVAPSNSAATIFRRCMIDGASIGY